MKQSVRTIVNAIESEIDYVKKNSHLFENSPTHERDFDYGKFTFEIDITNKKVVGGEWDEVLNETYIKITPKSVSVTNENNKELTNLSKEVFNKLELTYTNY